jgi:hypothetical protein
LPDGEKVLCFSVRRQGKKQQVKLTMEQIEKELKDV